MYTYIKVFNIIDFIQSELLAINQLDFAKVSPCVGFINQFRCGAVNSTCTAFHLGLQMQLTVNSINPTASQGSAHDCVCS